MDPYVRKKGNTSMCVANNCSMRGGTNLLSKIKMFKFPAEPKRRKLWEVAVRRKNWAPTKSSHLCCKHFVSGAPSSDPLHVDYVPTIFSHRENNIIRAVGKIQRYERHIGRRKVGEVPKPVPVKKRFAEAATLTDLTIKDNDSTGSRLPLNSTLVERKNWEPSDHFTEVQIDKTSKSCVILRQNAVPEIIRCPPYIEKIEERSAREQHVFEEYNESSTDNRLGEVNNSASLNMQASPLSSRYSPIYFGEDESSSYSFVREAEENLKKAQILKAENEKLKKRLKESDQLLENYRKRIKTLQQQNRSYRSRLLNMKHSVLVQLQKRQYISSDRNFKNDSDGCLLDRNSIKICDSSDSENLDEDI